MRTGQANVLSKASLDIIDDTMREKWWKLHRDNNIPVKNIAVRFGVHYYTVARYIGERKKQAG